MDFEDIERLRNRHPAWRLLRAGNAALVLSFLGRWFVNDNSGSTSASVLSDALEDDLYAFNTATPDGPRFPRGAADYLDDWAQSDSGWLRRFFRPARTRCTTTPPLRSRRRTRGPLAWACGVRRNRVAPAHCRPQELCSRTCDVGPRANGRRSQSVWSGLILGFRRSIPRTPPSSHPDDDCSAKFINDEAFRRCNHRPLAASHARGVRTFEHQREVIEGCRRMLIVADAPQNEAPQ